MEEVISQEEIDALLGVLSSDDKENHGDKSYNFEDTSKVPPEVMEGHLKRLAHIRDCKSGLLEIMQSCGDNSTELLELINKGVDHRTEYRCTKLLGDYYAFLNRCHTELKHLDELADVENRNFNSRVRLESELKSNQHER